MKISCKSLLYFIRIHSMNFCLKSKSSSLSRTASTGELHFVLLAELITDSCAVILLTGDLGGVIDTTKSTSSSSSSRSSSPATARQSLSRPLLDESC
uniref:Uncharacterized protein n=1 Tax=Glossina palpalis gambiensis TaxID=67801 RepID=A0A1B0B1U7_9MUSC